MVADTPKLASLLNQTAIQDRKAFAQLYERTSRRVYSIALRVLENRAEADDASQETYLKIWRRAHQFDEHEGSASSWIAAIARNHAIDLKRGRAPEASLIDDDFELASSNATPEELSIASSESAAIDECMRRLEPERAEAVKRAYIEGLTYQELAAIYAVPLNTMRTWLRRSLLILRDCLS